MKDSKKFHSKKKIEEVAEYIKENAIAWSCNYEDEKLLMKLIFYKQRNQQCINVLKTMLPIISKTDIDYDKILNYWLMVIILNHITILNKTKTK